MRAIACSPCHQEGGRQKLCVLVRMAPHLVRSVDVSTFVQQQLSHRRLARPSSVDEGSLALGIDCSQLLCSAVLKQEPSAFSLACITIACSSAFQPFLPTTAICASRLCSTRSLAHLEMAHANSLHEGILASAIHRQHLSIRAVCEGGPDALQVALA